MISGLTGQIEQTDATEPTVQLRLCVELCIKLALSNTNFIKHLCPAGQKCQTASSTKAIFFTEEKGSCQS